MVDYLRDREIEMWNYLRVNMIDPNGRGKSHTDLLDSEAGQVEFILSKNRVKHIDSVKVDGVIKYMNYDYKVEFGEGANGKTTITLKESPGEEDDIVEIVYSYGKSMINEGFAREDVELPRINIIPMDINQEYVSIGEHSDGTGAWIYYNCSYRVTLRSRYAKQLKSMYDTFSKLINKYRQSTPQPYGTIEPRVIRITPQDFDNELRLYQAEIYFSVKWLIKYKD